jgi:hypothetical protein
MIIDNTSTPLDAQNFNIHDASATAWLIINQQIMTFGVGVKPLEEVFVLYFEIQKCIT